MTSSAPAEHPNAQPGSPQQRSGRLHSVYAPVFYPALGIIVTVVVVALLAPDWTGELLLGAQASVVSGFGWYYALIATGFVAFALWMGLSRFGDIKLGPDDEEPEFGVLSWFSMLFAAGMGIGLVFYGVAEPLNFFGPEPRPGSEVVGLDAAGEPIQASTTQLAENAMAQTFLHWGLHAWAIYVVVGLALAYAIHRKGRPVSIRWALEPLLGDRVRGRIGDTIDVIAVVGTVFGVATSLGLGVQQIAAGIGYLQQTADGSEYTGGQEPSNVLLIGIIVVVTGAAIFSVVSGVGRGIKWLSNANLSLAAAFLITLFLLGPTLFLMREFVESFGAYLGSFLSLSFDAGAYTGAAAQEWQGTWTIFYWGWWMSWAPFVGVFIARISRGRTVRQFVAGVLGVPTLVTFLWFAVLGGSAIYRETVGEGGLIGADGVDNDAALFQLIGDLPLGSVLSVAAIVLVAIFFVTSSDSGSLVVDMLASGGDTDPPKWSRVLWSVIEGAVAIALLLAGGLLALQAGAILTALPFSVIMLMMCVATYRALRAEHEVLVRAQRRQRTEELAREVGTGVSEQIHTTFDQRYGPRVDQRIRRFLQRRGRSGTDGHADHPEPDPSSGGDGTRYPHDETVTGRTHAPFDRG